VLDPNVVGHTDSGGVISAPLRATVGRRNVAQRLLGFLRGFGVSLVPIPVNGEPGVLAYQDDRLMAVIALSIRDGRIDHLHAIANPHKLAYAASLLGAQTIPPSATAPLSGAESPSRSPQAS
jgi:RNA polymerase sigma-70 factor, ECF subfamily